MATRLELPKFQAFDANGDPLSGGLLYTYIAGTTTAKATYTDRDAGTPNANPIVLDSRGEALIYGVGSYKFVLKTSADVTIWTVDNIRGINESNSTTIADYSGDFDAAITDIGATETTLIVDSAATMSGVVTVPVTCSVRIDKGGSIDQSTYALAFNGPFECGPFQAFTGTGAVTFGSVSVDEIYPEWWGVDGTADDVQLQAAITAGASIDSAIELIQDLTLAAEVTVSANTTIFSRNAAELIAVNSLDAHMLEITGSNVKIDSVNFDGNKANQSAGTDRSIIYCGTTASNVTIENCVMKDAKKYAIQVIATIEHWRVRYNTIKDTENSSISFQLAGAQTANDIDISHNYVEGSTVNGIQVYHPVDTSDVLNVKICNNTCVDITGVPLEIAALKCEYAVVTGNIVKGSGTNGISVIGSYMTVADNFVSDQSVWGIECGYGSHNTITGNIIKDCGYGIVATSSGLNYFTISNNLIDTTTATSSADGIRLTCTAGGGNKYGTISGNTIVDVKGKGIFISGQALGDASDINVTGNTITFTAVRSEAPIGISAQDTKRLLVSGNLITTSVAWAGTTYASLIYFQGDGNEDVVVSNNDIIAIGTIDHVGIRFHDANTDIVTINNNRIKGFTTGVHTSGNTHPKVDIRGNIITDCTTDITAHASHRVEKLAASPTQGALWKVGDVVWETVPTDSNPPGWICATNVKTEMRVAAVVTATTMEVDSTTGMSTGDICGVELDDGTWHWTTATVTDGNTLELGAGLAGDGAAIDNDVICTKWLPLAETGTVKV